ncbi:MAG: energy transducer TonB [Bacteroidota bacterium]
MKWEFVVHKDGHLSDFRIITPQGFGFDEEAMRVMKEYSTGYKWFPATLVGEHVSEKVVIPLDFTYRQ